MGSQIQNKGRTDVTVEGNNGVRPGSRLCEFCGAGDHYKFIYEKHIKTCSKIHVCVCGFKVIKGWKSYKKHPDLIEHQKNCQQYFDWRKSIDVSCAEKGRLGYEKIKERGEVDEWKKKISSSMIEMLDKNPEERERRRKVAIEALNKYSRSEEGRQKSRETAYITSAREDIQKNRAIRLQKWRDENPDKFFEQVIMKRQMFSSKPENMLFIECEKIDSLFLHNYQLSNKLFTNKTKRRQIDICHPIKKIIIEFDGVYHFKQISKNISLEQTKMKDDEINTVLVNEGYTVIRVSHDQFDYKKGGSFNNDCLQKIKEIISSGDRGLFKIGESYGKD